MRNRDSKLIIFLVMSLITCFTFSGIAIADNAGLGDKDYQPITKTVLSEEEKALIDEQDNDAANIVKLLEEARKNNNTKTANENLEVITALREYVLKWKGAQADSLSFKADSVTPFNIYSVVLNVPAVGQETDYYCGPASAVQLIKFLGFNKNPNDNRNTTQANLANDLETTSDGTPFIGKWQTTLKNWTNRTYTGVWSPSQSSLWNSAVVSAHDGYPVIYDAYISPSTAYLPGYNGKTLYHYITGDGYEEDTNLGTKMIHYVDPNKKIVPHMVLVGLSYRI